MTTSGARTESRVGQCGRKPWKRLVVPHELHDKERTGEVPEADGIPVRVRKGVTVPRGAFSVTHRCTIRNRP